MGRILDLAIGLGCFALGAFLQPGGPGQLSFSSIEWYVALAFAGGLFFLFEGLLGGNPEEAGPATPLDPEPGKGQRPRVGAIAKGLFALGPEFIRYFGVLFLLGGAGYYGVTHLPKDLGRVMNSQAAGSEAAPGNEAESGEDRGPSPQNNREECLRLRQNILGQANALNKEGLEPEAFRMQLEGYALRNGYGCPAGGEFQYDVSLNEGGWFTVEISCSTCR